MLLRLPFFLLCFFFSHHVYAQENSNRNLSKKECYTLIDSLRVELEIMSSQVLFKSSEVERFNYQVDSISKLNKSLKEKTSKLEKILDNYKLSTDSLRTILFNQDLRLESLVDSISVLQKYDSLNPSLDVEDGLNEMDFYSALVTSSHDFMNLTAAEFFYSVRSFVLECDVLHAMRETNTPLCRYDLCYSACFDLISLNRPEFLHYSSANRSEAENDLKTSIRKVLCINSKDKSMLALELGELWFELRQYVFDYPYTCVHEVVSIDKHLVVSVDFGGTLGSIVIQDYLIEKSNNRESISRNGSSRGFLRD